MHELSIALSLLDQAKRESLRHSPARLVAIRVRIGPLSGVDPEALASAFDLARESEQMDSVRLHIEWTPLLVACPNCGVQPPRSMHELRCSSCCGPVEQLIQGRELDLVALEIEEAS